MTWFDGMPQNDRTLINESLTGFGAILGIVTNAIDFDFDFVITGKRDISDSGSCSSGE